MRPQPESFLESSFETVRTASAVRERVAAWRSAAARIAFVPTMGNLHAGHLSLVDLARARASHVVVSIFVNPTQFGPNEDIASYPRTPREDTAALEHHGRTDLLFAPPDSEIYPFGTRDITTIGLPALADDLCGRSRPGHFSGVASVVLRLLNIVRPDVLVVGRKDYQQMVLLMRMIEDLHLDVSLVAGEIMREDDGLAMSSRNRYLDESDRRKAPQLASTLQSLADDIRRGRDFAERRSQSIDRLHAAGFRVDYLELRNAADLSEVRSDGVALERVLLGAAWLGRARLIDNVTI